MRKTLFLVAIAGLLVSGYLAVTYAIDAEHVACPVGGGCDVVRQSDYASIFGISTPLYGVFFYLVLAIMAVLWLPTNKRLLRWPLAIWTAIGLITSGVLTYIEAYVIYAWCFWCVVSAIIATIAFGLVWARVLIRKDFIPYIHANDKRN